MKDTRSPGRGLRPRSCRRAFPATRRVGGEADTNLVVVPIGTGDLAAAQHRREPHREPEAADRDQQVVAGSPRPNLAGSGNGWCHRISYSASNPLPAMRETWVSAVPTGLPPGLSKLTPSRRSRATRSRVSGAAPTATVRAPNPSATADASSAKPGSGRRAVPVVAVHRSHRQRGQRRQRGIAQELPLAAEAGVDDEVRRRRRRVGQKGRARHDSPGRARRRPYSPAPGSAVRPPQRDGGGAATTG